MSGPYREIKYCRLCTSADLEPLWNLGEQYVMDYPKPGGTYISKAPLDLVMCDGCGLVQLRHTVDRDLLYQHYYYRSGISGTMRTALKEVVEAASRAVNLLPGDIVADIGCNDGTLLDFYSNDLTTIGYDPSDIAKRHIDPRHILHNSYFPGENEHAWLKPPLKRWKVITSVACFYDVPNPLQFMSEVADLLHPEGAWICQMNYTPSAIDANAFDFISHEHLTYWTLDSLRSGLDKVGLEVFDIDLLPLNGGTARFYIQHEGARPIIHADKLRQIQAKDDQYSEPNVWHDFRERVDRNRTVLRGILATAHSSRLTVAVYGASTRGNSLLQYYGLDVEQLPYAADRDPNKWGRIMAGTNIPIISEEEARARKPDYFLVLPYSYIEEFKVREKEFLDRGGKFIVPLPEAKVVG